MAAMLDNINSNDISILIISPNDSFINGIIGCYLFSGMNIDVVNFVEYSFRKINENFYDVIIIEMVDYKNDIFFSIELKQKFLIDTPIIAIGEKESSLKDLYCNYLYDCYIDDCNDYASIRARIISLVRRNRMIYNKVVFYDNLLIDMRYYKVKYKDEYIKLPVTSIKFLYYLINKMPNVLFDNEIVHYLHGNKQNGNKTFRSQLCRLKLYLKNLGWDNIKTIPHIGYIIKNRNVCKTDYNKENMSVSVACLTEDMDLQKKLEKSFLKFNFKYCITSCIEELINLVNESKCNIVIIDLIINSIDAIAITRNIRDKINSSVYIIVLVNDKFIGSRVLYNGADDIIQKPIDNNIIELKLQFLLKKYNRTITEEEFEWNGLHIFPKQHIAVYNNKEIILPPISFNILLLLIRNAPDIVTFNEIKDTIFGKSETRQNLIFCHTTKIRKELKRVGYDDIKTVPHIGLGLY